MAVQMVVLKVAQTVPRWALQRDTLRGYLKAAQRVD